MDEQNIYQTSIAKILYQMSHVIESFMQMVSMFMLDKLNLCLFFVLLQTYIAGATAPQSKWNDDGVKLRSAAISMTVL